MDPCSLPNAKPGLHPCAIPSLVSPSSHFSAAWSLCLRAKGLRRARAPLWGVSPLI